jgi:hypothetical protein
MRWPASSGRGASIGVIGGISGDATSAARIDGLEACLAAAAGMSLLGRVDAPIQIITKRNVARAQARYPEPVEPFMTPFGALLHG